MVEIALVNLDNGDGKVAGKDLIPLGKLKAPVQEILKLGDSLEVVIEK